MKHLLKENAIPVLFIAAAVGFDQWVKRWAAGFLARQGTLPVFDGVFHLTYAENRGAAFNLLQGQRWFLAGIALTAVVLIAAALYKGWLPTRLSRWAAYCVIAGAAGNAIDRIRLGYVVDLFDFRLIRFAIFNVADTFVTIGGGLFILYLLISTWQERRGGKPADHGEA